MASEKWDINAAMLYRAKESDQWALWDVGQAGPIDLASMALFARNWWKAMIEEMRREQKEHGPAATDAYRTLQFHVCLRRSQ